MDDHFYFLFFRNFLHSANGSILSAMIRNFIFFFIFLFVYSLLRFATSLLVKMFPVLIFCNHFHFCWFSLILFFILRSIERSRSITNEINYCLCYRSVFNIKIFIYKIYYSILHSISEFKSVNETKAKCDLF